MAKSLDEMFPSDDNTGFSSEEEKEQFKTLYANKNENLDYVFALSNTDKRMFKIGKANEENVYIRVLTVNEDILSPLLVEELISKVYKLNKDSETLETAKSLEYCVVRLMLASCPEPVSMNAGIKEVNESAKLKYVDLKNLSVTELSYLFTAQKELEEKLNPKIDELEPADLNFIVESIKKNEQHPSDFNWHVLTQIVEHMIKEE